MVALAAATGEPDVGAWIWPSPIWVTTAAEVATPGWPSESWVAMGATVLTAAMLLGVDMAIEEAGASAAELAAELASMLEAMAMEEATEVAMDGEGMVTPTEPQSCWAKATVADMGC